MTEIKKWCDEALAEIDRLISEMTSERHKWHLMKADRDNWISKCGAALDDRDRLRAELEAEKAKAGNAER